MQILLANAKIMFDKADRKPISVRAALIFLFLRVIMINRRYVYINITSLEFVIRKYAGVKYCFLIIAISVFSI